jgi:serine protease Do
VQDLRQTGAGTAVSGAIRGRLMASSLVLALAFTGCGASSDEAAAPGDTSTSTTETGLSRGTVVSGIDDAQDATIQIIAQGSFRDPEVGQYSGAGSGSGFFISPDGLAVTNQHVVTGAATLEIFIGGDTTRSYNAQVLGVSECNDLAVLQVNVPGQVTYFEWYEDEPRAGLDVYAAGYPLGEPEFTLTRGIVAKAKAGGDLTGTSSIDHTLEHDANIQPGNSGGPLITQDGKVIGINYAGGARASSTEQFFAIASVLARDVIERLQGGDFESLGINGWAVFDGSAGIAGIWVAGVEPGSPASQAKVLPGDIVTTMNGLPVGTDGTYKDYCDVIRTSGPRPIAIEVLRYDTSEVLRGEINGDRPLEFAFSFAQELQGDAGVAAGASYVDYVSLQDDTGLLLIEVPSPWRDIDTTPDVDDAGQTIPFIAAAPDLQAFYETWNTPGVVFGALSASDWTVRELIDVFAQPENCRDAGLYDFDDGIFVGAYQLWEGCGGTGSAYVVLVTTPAAGGRYIFVTAVQAVTTADLEALDHIFATFDYVA